jgi:hypothetical protein
MHLIGYWSLMAVEVKSEHLCYLFYQYFLTKKIAGRTSDVFRPNKQSNQPAIDLYITAITLCVPFKRLGTRLAVDQVRNHKQTNITSMAARHSCAVLVDNFKIRNSFAAINLRGVSTNKKYYNFKIMLPSQFCLDSISVL